MNVKTVAAATLLAGTSLVAISVLFGSWYTVPEGYRGVITRNNAVVGIAQPGLGFKLPWFDAVTDMSIQTERADFEGLAAYSKDIQQATNYVTVNYRLEANAVERMYSEVGTDYARRLINARVFKHLKEVFGQYTAADIVNKRQEVSNAVEQGLAEDLSAFGIVVEDVQIANIDFSDTYEQAVEAAATAEAEVKREKQKLEQIKISAQQQIAQAEAKAQAIKAEADANAYARRVQGEAEAAAIAARGAALRNNPDLIELTAAERWSGNLPTSMVPGGAVPFLSLPSPQPYR